MAEEKFKVPSEISINFCNNVRDLGGKADINEVYRGYTVITVSDTDDNRDFISRMLLDFKLAKIRYIKNKDVDISKNEAFGVYILELISSPSIRQATIGDILEAREDIRDRDGERKAQIYFWWQVTRTFMHFSLSAIKRVGWIAAVLGFFGWVARQFSS
jgi:hypothetical protein